MLYSTWIGFGCGANRQTHKFTVHGVKWSLLCIWSAFDQPNEL